MAYLTVTTQVDVVDASDGQLSLREAVAQANASGGIDTIRFSAAVVGQTLVLTGGELTITNDLIIDGNDGGQAAQTTIDANQASRVLSITGAGTEARVNGLAITHGWVDEQPGGGISLASQTSLTLTDCLVSDNLAGGDVFPAGGGIFASSKATLILERTTVSRNSGGGYGGGIYASSANLVIRNSIISGNSAGSGGGMAIRIGSAASIDSTQITHNSHDDLHFTAGGGGVFIGEGSSVTINRSVIAYNESAIGGGISLFSGNLALWDSTIAKNKSISENDYSSGGGIESLGRLFIGNSTITGNVAGEVGVGVGHGGGIAGNEFDIANSIVTGNVAGGAGTDSSGSDIYGSITLSNGHNVFGTDITGNVTGDLENVAPATLFAAIDPSTGGGQLSSTGIVPLRENLLSNPALSAADPMTASAFGQLGITPRPQPAGSLSDLGPTEANQKLSTNATTGNDVITGANAANNLVGFAGNDYLKGLGGKDMLDGGDGSDVLDGGPANDVLKGGLGVDLVTYAGNTAVVVDLSATPATAKRGGETDTLIGIEGAIGSSKADTFKGDANNNEFQGGLGKDSSTGGAGRDTYDFNAVADSPAGPSRDVITDFVHSKDVIDVAGIDADKTVPGNQSFRWVGKTTLTGAAQLGYYISGGNTIIRASNDADAAAEVEIQLKGVKTLTERDFRF